METGMQNGIVNHILLPAVILLYMIMNGCSDGKSTGSATLLDEGIMLFQQGKYGKAADKYREAIQKDPGDHVAYNLLGMAYRFQFNRLGAQKYKDKEIEAFRKSIELEPDYWAAYKNLAASLYYQGRKKEAVPYLEKALQLQPDDPEKELLLQWIEEGKSL